MAFRPIIDTLAKDYLAPHGKDVLGWTGRMMTKGAIEKRFEQRRTDNASMEGHGEDIRAMEQIDKDSTDLKSIKQWTHDTCEENIYTANGQSYRCYRRKLNSLDTHNLLADSGKADALISDIQSIANQVKTIDDPTQINRVWFVVNDIGMQIGTYATEAAVKKAKAEEHPKGVNNSSGQAGHMANTPTSVKHEISDVEDAKPTKKSKRSVVGADPHGLEEDGLEVIRAKAKLKSPKPGQPRGAAKPPKDKARPKAKSTLNSTIKPTDDHAKARKTLGNGRGTQEDPEIIDEDDPDTLGDTLTSPRVPLRANHATTQAVSQINDVATNEFTQAKWLFEKPSAKPTTDDDEDLELELQDDPHPETDNDREESESSEAEDSDVSDLTPLEILAWNDECRIKDREGMKIPETTEVEIPNNLNWEEVRRHAFMKRTAQIKKKHKLAEDKRNAARAVKFDSENDSIDEDLTEDWAEKDENELLKRLDASRNHRHKVARQMREAERGAPIELTQLEIYAWNDMTYDEGFDELMIDAKTTIIEMPPDTDEPSLRMEVWRKRMKHRNAYLNGKLTKSIAQETDTNQPEPQTELADDIDETSQD